MKKKHREFKNKQGDRTCISHLVDFFHVHVQRDFSEAHHYSYSLTL